MSEVVYTFQSWWLEDKERTDQPNKIENKELEALLNEDSPQALQELSIIGINGS